MADGTDRSPTDICFDNHSKTIQYYCGINLFVKNNVFVLGSWVRYFMGNSFLALQNRTIHHFVKRSKGRKFVSKGNQ